MFFFILCMIICCLFELVSYDCMMFYYIVDDVYVCYIVFGDG